MKTKEEKYKELKLQRQQVRNRHKLIESKIKRLKAEFDKETRATQKEEQKLRQEVSDMDDALLNMEFEIYK